MNNKRKYRNKNKIMPLCIFTKGYYPFVEDTMEAIDNYDLLCKINEKLDKVIEKIDNE